MSSNDDNKYKIDRHVSVSSERGGKKIILEVDINVTRKQVTLRLNFY